MKKKNEITFFLSNSQPFFIVMLWLQTSSTKMGLMNLGGSLTRVYEKKDANLLTKTKSKYSSEEDKEEKERQDMMRGHVRNIGQSVETMENRMRNGLSEIYFSKTKDIVNACRSVNTLVDEHHKKEISSEIHKRLRDGFLLKKTGSLKMKGSSKDVFKEKKFFFQINEEFILGLLGHFL